MERRRDTDVGTSKRRTAARICNEGARRNDGISPPGRFLAQRQEPLSEPPASDLSQGTPLAPSWKTKQDGSQEPSYFCYRRRSAAAKGLAKDQDTTERRRARTTVPPASAKPTNVMADGSGTAMGAPLTWITWGPSLDRL